VTEEPERTPQPRWLTPALIAGGALAFCLCALVITSATSGLLKDELLRLGLGSALTTTPSARVSTSTFPPTRTSGSASATTTPAQLSPEIRAAMDDIQSQVAQLRGLKPLDPVERQLISPADLKDQVESDFLSSYSQSDAENDSRVYALLGLLPPGFDLWDFYTQLYAEQVAGYYDDQDKIMYVVQGSSFDGPERLTYAHEYTHALQDQHFGLRDNLGYSESACQRDSERCAGIRALIEGDATQLEDQWLRNYATQQDVDQILAFYNTFQSPVYDSAPNFLQESFAFPYSQGLAFIQSLYRDGSWATVDAAYLNPPISTEQILHPQRYPADRPVNLAALDGLDAALGPDWTKIDDGTFGELFTRQVMEAFIPKDTAAKAAEGWGGDIYQALAGSSSGETSLVLISIWDTIRDSQEAALALRDYGDARFGDHLSTGSSYRWDGGQTFAIVDRQSNQTLLILAPDQAAAEALQAAVPFPRRKR
jgi:hypothetical protein